MRMDFEQFVKLTQVIAYISCEFRAAATPKMERFVITVSSFQPLTIITKRSILDVVAALDPPLHIVSKTDTVMQKAICPKQRLALLHPVSVPRWGLLDSPRKM